VLRNGCWYLNIKRYELDDKREATGR